MRKNLVTAAAWLAATLASIVLTTSAVSSVRDEVTNRPSPLRAGPAAVALATTSGAPLTVAPSSSSGSPSSSTVTTISGSSVTTPPTTTSAPAPPSTTTTSAPQSTTSTTTTAAPSAQYFKSYQLVGGWVRLRVDGGNVWLDGAVPSPGFSLDIKKDGPESVVVEFESDSHESKLHSEVGGDGLKTEIEESDEE